MHIILNGTVICSTTLLYRFHFCLNLCKGRCRDCSIRIWVSLRLVYDNHEQENILRFDINNLFTGVNNYRFAHIYSFESCISFSTCKVKNKYTYAYGMVIDPLFVEILFFHHFYASPLNTGMECVRYYSCHGVFFRRSLWTLVGYYFNYIHLS